MAIVQASDVSGSDLVMAVGGGKRWMYLRCSLELELTGFCVKMLNWDETPQFLA